MVPAYGADGDKIGQFLLERGCRQGAVIQVPSCTLWLEQAGDNDPSVIHWVPQHQDDPKATFVVVSQDCDIWARATAEPHVEVMTVFLTKDRGQINMARKGNSSRRFLLQEIDQEGMVADATHRAQIAKRALESAAFRPVLTAEHDRQRFANWVAGRYNRPAIPNHLVAIVQKPLQDSLNSLMASVTPLVGVLNKFAELRFVISDGAPPWDIKFVGIRELEEVISVEEEATVADWLRSTINAAEVKEIYFLPYASKEISVHDYLATTRLQFDHYTPAE
jgi:hypothetical protein